MQKQISGASNLRSYEPVERAQPVSKVQVYTKISGTISHARGFQKTKLLGKLQPYVLIKGIKGNSNLVEFGRTPLSSGKNPVWNADWSFDCTKVRSRDEFVGVRFVVFDGDEFLGGADLDISSISSYSTVTEELDLLGLFFHNVKGVVPKKARLYCTCSVDRQFVPVLERPQKALLDSMKSYGRVVSIAGRIVKARGLAGKDARLDKDRSWPVCFVRVIMKSGKVLDLKNTKCSPEVVDPVWNESFVSEFDDEMDQPLMLMFDVWGSGGAPRFNFSQIRAAGDHLGSAMVPVAQLGDEGAFTRGEGRIRIPLCGECQLYENRLERDAGRADREKKQAEDKANGVIKKETWKDRLSTAMHFAGASAKGLSQMIVGKSSYDITLELFAARQEIRMPHYDLLHGEVVVEQTDVVATGDQELIDVFNGPLVAGEKVKRIAVTGEDRIFAICGRMKAGSDLVAADLNGKSDPYLIVDALTKSGNKEFVYRTRFIKGTLCPQWNEAFCWQVPPDPVNPNIPVAVSKLQFSIYDTDEFQTLEQGEDDYLGAANVDIANMRNRDFINEELPLLGCKERPGGGKPQAGFRRSSTISIEVSVCRGVYRTVNPQHNYDASLLNVARHHDSRGRVMVPPIVKRYTDLANDTALQDPGVLDETAARILHLRDTDTLLKCARIREAAFKLHEGVGWMAVRPKSSSWDPSLITPSGKGDQSVEDALDEEQDDVVVDDAAPFRRDWDSLKQDFADKMTHAQEKSRSVAYVNRLPPMSRTASLPSLVAATRFGGNYERLAADPFAGKAKNSEFHSTSFSTVETKNCNAVAERMRVKPPSDQSTGRRIATAPASGVESRGAMMTTPGADSILLSRPGSAMVTTPAAGSTLHSRPGSHLMTTPGAGSTMQSRPGSHVMTAPGAGSTLHSRPGSHVMTTPGAGSTLQSRPGSHVDRDRTAK
jgi:hypothetical protein